MLTRRNILIEQLEKLLTQAKPDGISVETMLKTLEDKGHAAVLIILSLPFCLPIQIPGASTIFGLLIAFVGLRISFGHRSWLPKTLLEKTISYSALKKINFYTTKVIEKLRFFISTRWVWFIHQPALHIAHGITIALLAGLLALPLPIPLTNIVVALPILAFGLAMLEDDGLLIIIAYVLSFLAFTLFFILFLYGKEGLIYLHKLLF